MKQHVPYRYFRTAMIARLSSLRVAAEPGPRYRALGAAAARPGGRLAQPPLPPEAASVGLGHRCVGSMMYTDIACAAAPRIRPPGARNAAICTFTTDCWARAEEAATLRAHSGPHGRRRSTWP